MALGDTLRRGCEQCPEKQALLVEERAWTYAELNAITDQIAARLMERGIGPGDRVALHFANSAELVFGYYACFKVGAVAVPLNVRLKGPELEYILHHCGARLYVGQSDLFPEVQSVRSGLGGVEGFYLCGDGAAFPDVRPIEDLLAPAAGEGVRERASERVTGPTFGSLPHSLTPTFPSVHEDAPAVILYTSGTTARPKGVTHTHATLARAAVNYRAYCGLEGTDVVGIVLPMAHIFGFALLLLPTISAGATVVVIPRFEPELVLRRLEEHRVTHFGGLPVMYNALVNSPEATTRNLRSLRFCLAGGDAVPTELQRRFQESFGPEITAACGMTEVIPYAGNPPYGTKKAGAIGPPTPGVSLRLVDDAGNEVAPGEVGEILVRSPHAMVGYWEDPEATAATIEDGWLRTGDLGQLDEDGYYWFVGRKKEIIVRGGSNISPLEVEEALYQHPAVREAGVIGVPDAALGETVHAYVALKQSVAATEEELKEFMSTRMAAYKVPERIHFLPDLPKGLTGKIHRKTLKEMAAG